jgi:hypothetical protein
MSYQRVSIVNVSGQANSGKSYTMPCLPHVSYSITHRLSADCAWLSFLECEKEELVGE